MVRERYQKREEFKMKNSEIRNPGEATSLAQTPPPEPEKAIPFLAPAEGDLYNPAPRD
jgi:hypothetical protein